MNKNTIYKVLGALLGLLILTALGAFAVWRYEKYRQLPAPVQEVILRDTSDSGLGGCEAVAAIAKESLLSNRLGNGSAIAFMTTGDSSTAQEPVLLGSFDIPTSQRVIEGRAKILELQKDILDRIKQQCEQKGVTKESPIYLAIRRAAEYLRAKGCNGRQECRMSVQSDLEELSEPKIKALLKAPSPARKEVGKEPELPAPIDNHGIKVVICGISETTGTVGPSSGKKQTYTPNRDAARADRIVEVWTKLFTNPPLVTFNTHCPKS